MFKPHKYKKRTRGSFSIALKKRNRAKILVSLFFVCTGFVIFVSKILKPVVHSRLLLAEFRPIFSPVLGVRTYHKDFEFAELKSAERKTGRGHLLNAPEVFYLTIPKLKIFDAQVKVNSTTLDPADMLGHYYGTCLPGESCNSFIYGHATFEEYFNPKDYKTIFSTLPTKLTVGDQFYAKVGSKVYEYIVVLKKVLEPKDVNPYAEYFPEIEKKSTVTLMTCVPPGRRDYRMIVVGSLVRSFSSP